MITISSFTKRDIRRGFTSLNRNQSFYVHSIFEKSPSKISINKYIRENITQEQQTAYFRSHSPPHLQEGRLSVQSNVSSVQKFKTLDL